MVYTYFYTTLSAYNCLRLWSTYTFLPYSPSWLFKTFLPKIVLFSLLIQSDVSRLNSLLLQGSHYPRGALKKQQIKLQNSGLDSIRKWNNFWSRSCRKFYIRLIITVAADLSYFAFAISAEQPLPCQPAFSKWSTCSSDCGAGLSTRRSNLNAQCKPETETRMCQTRRCQDAPILSRKTHHLRVSLFLVPDGRLKSFIFNSEYLFILVIFVLFCTRH